MSTVQSGSPSRAPAPAVEDASKHWARHGAVLTACVVGINLLMVLLVFFYFWRFFSGKRGPPSSSSMAGGADDEEASSSDTSPAASPRASWRRLREWPARRRQEEEDIASSLPVSVYSSAASDVGLGDAGGSGKAAECAVCIVEFRDGDLARLLPRCGHRFHADCVGAWLRLHSTCPLCRATALPLAASTATASVPNNDDPKDAVAHCPSVRREQCALLGISPAPRHQRSPCRARALSAARGATREGESGSIAWMIEHATEAGEKATSIVSRSAASLSRWKVIIAMSTPTVQSGNSMLAPAPAVVEDPSKHWTRHGPVLTACLVVINLLMVLLIFFYFWRFFSGKRGPPTSSSTMAGGDDEEEGASSSADTPPAAASPGRHHQDREDIALSLPVFVYSSTSAAASDVGDGGESGKAVAECAVCIVEFRDGDRARLLPRCGHRFHADCVGAWLQLHSTCPLCRATVLPPAVAASSDPAKNDQPKDDDCPV
uniref:RING-type E3 ubiquitin transferase n=1 Tax=Oryza punctata TaxID=4537 RepID=A0A0E0L1I3_ORYPU